MIIVGLSFPVINKVKDKLNNNKVKTYADSIEHSAKLYVNSNSEDIFGNSKSGCYYIKYSDLEKRNLVKDINIDNLSCATENTFVKVLKQGDKYQYDTVVSCVNQGDDKIVNTYPSDSSLTYSPEECSPDGATFIFNAQENENSKNKSSKKAGGIIVTLSSISGISNDFSLDYAWSINKVEPNASEFQKLNLKIQGNQQELLDKKETITAKTTRELATPNITGTYYLAIRVNQLNDYWYSPYTGDNIVYLGPFTLDNEAPVINSFEIKSNSENYNNISTKLSINASDNITARSNLKYCIITSKNKCTKVDDFDRKLDDINYNFNNELDGSTKELSIKVMDEAENISKQATAKYTVYKQCSQKKSDGKWSDITQCDKTCGSGQKTQESNLIDNFTNYNCNEKTTRVVSCNTNLCAPNTPTISNSSNEKWTNKDVTIKASTTTPSNQIGYWYYSTDNKNWTRYNNSNGKNEYTPSNYNKNTDITLYIRVCNKEANIDNPEKSKCSSSKTIIKIDKTAPTCSVSNSGGTTGSNGWYIKDTVTAIATCSDTGGSGCTQEKTTIQTINSNTQSVGTTKEVTIYDNAGNTVKCSSTIKYDNTAPTCTSSGGNSAWRNTDLTITGTCEDTGSGCKNITKSYSQNTNSTKETPGTVEDNAGNKTKCPDNQTVKIDKTNPTLKSLNIISNTNDYNGLSTKLVIDATDNYTSYEELKYCIVTSTNNCTSASQFTKKLTDTTYNFSSLNGKEETITIKIMDLAGNISGSKSANYTTYNKCSDIVSDGNWSDSTTCTKTCGGGTKTQTSGSKDKYTGEVCSKKPTRIVSCNTHACKPATPTISNPTSGNWTKTSFAVTATTTTSSSNIGAWYYSYDEINWVKYDNSSGKNTYTTPQFTSEMDKTLYVKVCNTVATKATDSVNCSDSANTKIRIDKTAPQFSLTNGEKITCEVLNDTCLGGRVYRTITDNLSGFNTLKLINYDNGTPEKGVEQTITHDSVYTKYLYNASLTSSGEGWIFYQLTICDLAGNCTTDPTSGKLDYSSCYATTGRYCTGVERPATPKITNPTNKQWTNTDFSISAKTTSSSSIIGYWYYSYDDKTYQKYTDSYGKQEYKPAKFTTEMDKTLYIKVCNKNAKNPYETANCSYSTNTQIRLDKTAPTCTNSGGNTSWTNGNVTIIGSCVEKGNVQSGCKGNVSKTLSTDTNSTTLSPGTVEDNAGNKTTCASDRTVKIDKTAPVCNSDVTYRSYSASAKKYYITKNSWVNGDVQLKLTCTDDGGSGCVKTNILDTTITTEGTYKYGSTYSVTDNAGNTSKCPDRSINLDRTPPYDVYWKFTPYKNNDGQFTCQLGVNGVYKTTNKTRGFAVRTYDISAKDDISGVAFVMSVISFNYTNTSRNSVITYKNSNGNKLHRVSALSDVRDELNDDNYQNKSSKTNQYTNGDKSVSGVEIINYATVDLSSWTNNDKFCINYCAQVQVQDGVGNAVGTDSYGAGCSRGESSKDTSLTGITCVNKVGTTNPC